MKNISCDEQELLRRRIADEVREAVEKELKVRYARYGLITLAFAGLILTLSGLVGMSIVREFTSEARTQFEVAKAVQDTASERIGAVADETSELLQSAKDIEGKLDSLNSDVDNLDQKLFAAVKDSSPLEIIKDLQDQLAELSMNVRQLGIKIDATQVVDNTIGINRNLAATEKDVVTAQQRVQNIDKPAAGPQNHAIADGLECTDDGQCSSGYCYPGPPDNTQSFCLNRDLNCALPNKPGAEYGGTVTIRGATYECYRPPSGKARWRSN